MRRYYYYQGSPDGLVRTPFTRFNAGGSGKTDQRLTVTLPAGLRFLAFWYRVDSPAWSATDPAPVTQYLLDARPVLASSQVVSNAAPTAWDMYVGGVLTGSNAPRQVIPVGTWVYIVLVLRTTGTTSEIGITLNARFAAAFSAGLDAAFGEIRFFTRNPSNEELANPDLLNTTGCCCRLTHVDNVRLSPTTVQVTDVSGNGRHGTLQNFTV